MSQWQQEDGPWGVYQQVYNASGTARGSETLVNTWTFNNQFNQQVTALPGGGWVVTWESYGQDYADFGVYQQAYQADGTVLDPETRVNTHTMGDQFNQQVSALSGGGWVVTWESVEQDGSYSGVYQQVFDAGGAALGTETLVNTLTEGHQSKPQVTALRDGGWVVTWECLTQNGSSWDVYQQAYDTDGTERGDEVRVNTFTNDLQFAHQVTALSGGGWVVTWESFGQGESGAEIYQQVFSSDGTALGVETRVDSTSLNSQFGPQVVALADGGWVVTWATWPPGIGDGVFQQAFKADGSTNGSEIHIDTPTGGWANLPKVTTLVDGSWVVSWTSHSESNDTDIHQRTFWVNEAPTMANPLAGQVASEDTPFSYTVPADTFTDPDALDDLAYSAKLSDGSVLPSWLAFDPATRTFSGTPGNGHAGNLQIRVTATDLAGETVSTDFTLTVNDNPVVAHPIAEQSATEDQAFSFTVPADTFSDVLFNTLSYGATLSDGSDLPGWLTFDPQTRTFSGTPENGAVGTLEIRLTATDALGGKVSTDFTLAVANVNDAPTVNNPIPLQVATEDTPFSVSLEPDTFTDVDAGDTLTYTATLSNGDTLPEWLTCDPATGTFSGTPGNNDSQLEIRVTATDSGGKSAYFDYLMTVLNTNAPPTIGTPIAAQQANEDEIFFFWPGSETFVEIDPGGSLAYTATLANGDPLPSWLVFNSVFCTFSGQPGNDDVGNLTIRLTAMDSSGASVSTTFDLTVLNTNDASTPVGTIAAQQATEDQAFSFTVPAGKFTDVDVGDTITYSATLAGTTSLPSWLAFDPTTRTFSGTPENGDVGNLTILLFATDSAGGVNILAFSLNVANTNDAPTLPLTPSTFENAAISLDVLAGAGDVDGDTLTITVASVRSGFGSVFIRNGKLVYDPTTAPNQNIAAGDSRSVVIRYTVADSHGGTATTDLVIDVKGISPDVFKGNSGNNTLTGSIHGDLLYGYAGKDTLDGKTGADKMYGGAGDDTYVVDNAGDVIVELANEGTDLVKSSISHTLSNHVENLTLTGTSKLNAAGNALANGLTGNDADNTLDGKAGADRMAGGKGNDIYIVDSTSDVVVEGASAGTDLIKSSVSYTLSSHVENLTLTGASKLNGTGNMLANVLAGNGAANILDGKAGDDTLYGGAGADRLTGGSGADVFLFKAVAETTIASAGQDTILDFNRSQGDRISLKTIDANLGLKNDQAFTFIDTQKFHKKAGELRYEIKNGDTLISGDIDGDGSADFSVKLDLILTMKATDFIL